MNYSNLTNRSNIFIKRFSHSQRFILAAKLLSDYKSKKYLIMAQEMENCLSLLKIPKKNFFL